MSISKIRLPNNTEEDIKAKYLIQSTSVDTVSEEFVTKTTTEDAIANIQKIYGNTVKWNQLNRVQNNSETITGDTIINNQVSGYYYRREANHKYLYRARLTTLTASDAVYLMGSSYTVGIKTNELYSVIYNSTTTQDRGQSFALRSYGSGTFGWTDLCIYDLTEMYGAGNEPTIAEFEATYPAGFSPYTTTTLRSVNATAVQSKDSNNNVIGNCDLNIPTLTGKLNGTGSSVVIFPEGMGYDGVNRDELTEQKAIRKTKIVDMSTLTWTYSSYYTAFYCSSLPSDFKQAGSNTHIRSGRYTLLTSTASDPRTDADKTIKGYNGYLGYYLVIKDSSYTSAASLKTSLSGVNLCYEITSPQEYILDNALQLQYPVVAGGMEMVLPTTGTAPMKMDVIYGNAADATSNLSSNFISVDSMKAFLNNLGTQMGGTWNMQYNNGKFEFTFSSS